MKLKILNKSPFALPKYESEGASGFDIKANLGVGVKIMLQPLERETIPTGLFMETPLYYEVQIRPRSGNARKKGLGILNSPGTIDSDYRGEVGIIVVNLSALPVSIEHGDKVAQGVLCPIVPAVIEEVKELSDTIRGDKGFGSTGK